MVRRIYARSSQHPSSNLPVLKAALERRDVPVRTTLVVARDGLKVAAQKLEKCQEMMFFEEDGVFDQEMASIVDVVDMVRSAITDIMDDAVRLAESTRKKRKLCA
jgi:hypothetical protein